MLARHLPLNKQRKALSHLSGPYKTTIRGRGMEFESVRLYQPGDDVRTIDWRVTARVGKPHTKQFQEEKEKPVLIAVDQRQSMFFGSQHALKSVQACDVAAYIAWAALNKGDRVGGHIFNDNAHQDIRPKNQRKNILRLLHHLVEYNEQLSAKSQPNSLQIIDVLQELKRVAKPGTQIYLISDFYGMDEQCSALLRDLAMHCEIIAIDIFDPLEADLPKSGQYWVSNGQRSMQINSNSRKTRQHYQEDFASHRQAIAQLLGKYQIPLIPISTADTAIDVLQQYLGAKS